MSLNVLGKIMKNVNLFFIPIKKKIIKLDKKGNETFETTSYKTKSIDTIRFLATLLSNLVDNLTEGINKSRCKNYNYFLEYESAKNSLIQYKCLSGNNDYSKKLNEELKEKFKNTYNFSNNGINEFLLLLRNDVYPYEYMDDWEKFNETILP